MSSMLRTLRNLTVNIMAAFIRDREARHKFRNKYKRKSNFSKLRNDNRALSNDIAILKQEIGVIKRDIESIKTKNFFRYSPKHVENCKRFYSQLNTDEFTQKYCDLVRGLDEGSMMCIAQVLQRIKLVSKLEPGRGGLLDIYDEDEKNQLDKVRREFYSKIIPLSEGCWAYRQYILPTKSPELSALYYKHQMPYLKNTEKLKEKDFLDVGGYIGDSALVFTEYTNGKIYTFEPVSLHYELTLKTIEMNNCRNIVPIKMALGSKDETAAIKINGLASTLSKNNAIDDSPCEMVTVTTVDNFIKDKDVDIGLIKVDVEGFEQEFLKGAESTIRKYRPTMLISIYHNASDFFNIKPIIESWNLGYTFKVSRPVLGGIYHDTMLICEIL